MRDWMSVVAATVKAQNNGGETMTRKIVYVDMDGVLVDFESGLDRASRNDLREYEGRADEIPGSSP